MPLWHRYTCDISRGQNSRQVCVAWPQKCQHTGKDSLLEESLGKISQVSPISRGEYFHSAAAFSTQYSSYCTFHVTFLVSSLFWTADEQECKDCLVHSSVNFSNETCFLSGFSVSKQLGWQLFFTKVLNFLKTTVIFVLLSTSAIKKFNGRWAQSFTAQDSFLLGKDVLTVKYGQNEQF